MRCSLVIHACNEATHIGVLLEGLSRQTVRAVKVILVDSGSIDLWDALKPNLFWRSTLSIFWFRVAQFGGTYQGYRWSLEWNWSLR